ncbi:MAG: PEGA domain-containing protein [Polyangiales bacterium]
MNARWVAAAVVLVAPSAFADDNLALARQRFQKGLDLFGAGDFSGALVEFRASNALYASPNSRLYVARCLSKLGRLAEAFGEYERTIGEGEERAAIDPRYAEAAAAAKKEIETVRPKIARVRVQISGTLPKGARVEVGGKTLPPEAIGLLVPVMPGTIAVRVSAEGYRDAQTSVEVAAGATHTVQIALEPLPKGDTKTIVAPPPPERPAPAPSGLRTAAFVTLGVTGASAIAFGVLLLETDREHRLLVQTCVEKPCDDVTYDAYRDRGRHLQTWTNVALGVTAFAAVTTVTLFVLAPSPRSPVAVQVGPNGLAFAGRF